MTYAFIAELLPLSLKCSQTRHFESDLSTLFAITASFATRKIVDQSLDQETDLKQAGSLRAYSKSQTQNFGLDFAFQKKLKNPFLKSKKCFCDFLLLSKMPSRSQYGHLHGGHLESNLLTRFGLSSTATTELNTSILSLELQRQNRRRHILRQDNVGIQELQTALT